MTRKIILATILAALALPAAAIAESNDVGAPNSAAGGVHTEPLVPPATSLPSASGPLGNAPTISPSSRSTTPDIPARTIEPGTGKYRPPAGVPCMGSPGLNSSHQC
jgi:hypothetical protein